MANISGQYGGNKLVTYTRKDVERNIVGVNDDIKWQRDNRIATPNGYKNYSYTERFVIGSGVMNYKDPTPMKVYRYNEDGLMVETGDYRNVRESGGWHLEEKEEVFPI